MTEKRFDKMTVPQLKEEQRARGILDASIKGSGKDGNILKMDRVVALDKYEEKTTKTTESSKTSPAKNGSGRGKAGLGIGKQTKTSTKKTTKKAPAKKAAKKTKAKTSKSPVKSPTKKGGEKGMVIAIWDKDAYEYDPNTNLGSQSDTYYVDEPYVSLGTYEEVTKSNEGIIKVIDFHLKSKGVKGYTKTELEGMYIGNLSTRLSRNRFSDYITYFDVVSAIKV
jgi:hypothetical protein